MRNLVSEGADWCSEWHVACARPCSALDHEEIARLVGRSVDDQLWCADILEGMVWRKFADPLHEPQDEPEAQPLHAFEKQASLFLFEDVWDHFWSTVADGLAMRFREAGLCLCGLRRGYVRRMPMHTKVNKMPWFAFTTLVHVPKEKEVAWNMCPFSSV